MSRQELKDKDKIITHELIIKKSKFIAEVYYVDDEQKINGIILKVKEKHKDARHVVYAYRLKSTGRYTDDKEPQGTAGRPIYTLLEREDIINCLVIVIRYFGGILLGAGPLTRAYSTVANEALQKCEFCEYIEYEEQIIYCEYKDEEKTKRDLLNSNCIIQDIIRTDNVKIIYLKPQQ